MATTPWHHGVTRYQWLGLFIAWPGWVFDAMDATIYAIVLHPALHDLLRPAGGALFGYLGFGPLADRFGRRAVFAFMFLGSLIMLPVTYLTPATYARVLMLLPLLGFFKNGIFGGFPIYLPELYPTRLRATGSGFCFNAGRVLASASLFLTGRLVTALGSFGRAASTVALIYLAGLVVLLFAPETRGKPLPE